jgi:hypothetical protein
MDVVAPKRDRARERLCELDLVMLAVMINVNDGPFTALRQDAGFALDGVPDSQDAEFRNLECIVHYSANPPLADFIGRGETKSVGEPAGRCLRISTRRDQANRADPHPRGPSRRSLLYPANP